MGQDIAIRCRCGQFEAEVTDISADGTNRVICYCESCRKFATTLDRQDVLEEGGGTDLVMVGAGQLRIVKGSEFLVPMRLTEKGPLRWYASCCDTPIGNTAGTPAVPFISLVRRGVDLPEEPVGPVRAQLHRKSALAHVAPVGEGRGLAAVLLRFGRIVLAARGRGDHRRNPFFGPNRKPIARVRRIAP